MKCNFIHIKLKYKNNINKIKDLELFKLCFGKNITELNYNRNKKEYSKQNLEIIWNKIFHKKNIGKMKYERDKNTNEIKIFNKIFVLNNKKIVKIIINNKQFELKENIINEKLIVKIKIKIKFLDNIINLNSMFKDCKLLSSIYNFGNLNTKYLKSMHDLFYGCILLSKIDDISNWNTNYINDISKILFIYK